MIDGGRQEQAAKKPVQPKARATEAKVSPLNIKPETDQVSDATSGKIREQFTTKPGHQPSNVTDWPDPFTPEVRREYIEPESLYTDVNPNVQIATTADSPPFIFEPPTLQKQSIDEEPSLTPTLAADNMLEKLHDTKSLATIFILTKAAAGTAALSLVAAAWDYDPNMFKFALVAAAGSFLATLPDILKTKKVNEQITEIKESSNTKPHE